MYVILSLNIVPISQKCEAWGLLETEECNNHQCLVVFFVFLCHCLPSNSSSFSLILSFKFIWCLCNSYVVRGSENHSLFTFSCAIYALGYLSAITSSPDWTTFLYKSCSVLFIIFIVLLWAFASASVVFLRREGQILCLVLKMCTTHLCSDIKVWCLISTLDFSGALK